MQDSEAFRLAFRRLAAGVSVITALDPDGVPVGFTATSLASLAAVPPMATFNMARTASAWRAVEQTENVLVHIMGARNRAAAQQMLNRLQGRAHQVVTGVCLMHLRAHRERVFAVSTDVLFHPLTPGQIRDYLGQMNPLDKAGAYAIQDGGEKIISEISGSFSNVVGLPVEKLREELAKW